MSRWTKRRKRIRQQQEENERRASEYLRTKWDWLRQMIADTEMSDEKRADLIERLGPRP